MSGYNSLLLHALVLVCCCGSVFNLPEKEILLQFKSGITDDPYNSLSSWSIDNDPCQDYRGIYCNSAGNLDRIVLWNTSLAGVLSPALSGLSSLRVLTLFGNRFTGNIPTEYGAIQSLWKINVSSNSLSGSIPEFIGDLPNIRLLDLSRNSFSGEIPVSLFKNCGYAKFISFSHNALSGSIPESLANCSVLQGLDFSFNNLSGGVPLQVCGIPNFNYLSVRSNVLSGEVGEEILGCKSLELLDLGSNLFTGLAPFGILGLNNLTYFNVSHNQFQGELPDITSCSERLEVFDVSGNNFDGQIPVSIAKCQSLKLLSLGSNRINGTIPGEIADLKSLREISLGDNLLYGTIPPEFGSIELLQVLDLHNLNLAGTIPDDITNCRFLLELDLSGNDLQGEIPQTINNMTGLEILDLHRNQINGTIPQSVGSLLRMKVLDLSQNNLSGSIPSSLGNLSMLTHFNISFNDLSGIIPTSPNIQSFGSTAFFHNAGLCGSPLTTSCTDSGGVSAGMRNTKKLTVSTIVAIVAAALILVGICVVCFLNVKVQKRRKEVTSTPIGSTDSNVIIGKLVLFSKSLPSKYEDWEAGTKALLDKECLIGGGSLGTVYRATFEGGVSIAVKKLETLGRIRNQDEFELEIGRLGNLRHPNLVPVQGYYWSSTTQLILSEFVSNGNLYDNLHGLSFPGTSTGRGNSELNWSRRFEIALETARALSYLHNDCRPQILHLNIKSSNILLDANYEAKLSDYGLARLLPMLDNQGLTKFHTSVGYVAPELAQSLRLSDKCDVYSFGVILLELVTGRKPVESPGGNEVVILCDYVRELLESGTASDCFDSSLRGFAENELIQVMKLGLICTSEVPSRRPSVAEVVQVLESIRSEMGQ